MQRRKDEIIDYFRTYIFGFIFEDIKNCINARANYIVALALLSYTEYVGGLITGNLGLKVKTRENFYKAFKYFPKGYLDIDKKIKIQYVNEKNIAEIQVSQSSL